MLPSSKLGLLGVEFWTHENSFARYLISVEVINPTGGKSSSHELEYHHCK